MTVADVQVLAIMDIRRSGPASPRGKKGRSYHDLTAMRAASVPPTPGIGESPENGYISLPTTENENLAPPKLTMRKPRPEDEAGAGLGLDLSKGGEDTTGHGREKSD